MKTNNEDTAETINSNKISIHLFKDNTILLHVHFKEALSFIRYKKFNILACIWNMNGRYLSADKNEVKCKKTRFFKNWNVF